MSSSLADALERQIGGLTETETVRPSLREATLEMIRRTGSGRAAGRAIGVDERTIRRWKTGQTSEARRENAERLRDALTRQRTTTSFTRNDLRLKVRVDNRPRILTATNTGISPDAVNDMVRLYAIGQKELMAERFIAGVQDDFYREVLEEIYYEYEDREISEYVGTLVTVA